jgi:hypothetical protein
MQVVRSFFYGGQEVGADSGKVSSLLVCISVHSHVDYVSFDFLHKVDYHQLGWFFF